MIVAPWVPLPSTRSSTCGCRWAWSLNMVNGSMGRDDLYPFVLPAPVLEKMRFIHSVIDEIGTAAPAIAAAGGE